MTGAADPSASPGLDELTFMADGAGARRASAWLEAACRDHAIPRLAADRLLISLEEVLANVTKHGGPGALSVPVVLWLEVRRERGESRAHVTVSDAGRPFDPLSVPERALPATLEEASPNGMGLQVLRRFAQDLHYRHQDGRNHLTFGTAWSSGG